MRLLYLTPVVPTPFRGRRPYNFLRCVAPEHEVRLLALPYQQGTAADAERLQREWGVDVTLLPQAKAASLAACARGLWQHDIPLRALYCTHSHIARALRQAIDDFQPDVVHLDRVRLAHYAEHTGDIPTVVDLPDALGLYYERLLELESRPHVRLLAQSEAARLRRFEQRYLPRADRVLVCSPVDEAAIVDYAPTAPLQVITNVTDTDEFCPQPGTQTGPPRLVFTGTLSYQPNLDGLLWYLQHVAPLLATRNIDPTPVVAGVSWSRRKVERALRGKPIHQLGFVPHLPGVLQRNDLYLCPLRLGVGVRNKLLEAMACGMACVSTTLGCEGMHVEPGRDLLTADTPETFADAIATLYHDPARRRLLGEAARAAVCTYHSLQQLKYRAADLYEELVK